MHVLCYLFVLTTLVAGNVVYDEDTAIVNGDRADIHDYPFYAYLGYPSGSILCGGTIVRPNVILTASHCLPEEGDPNFAVWLGVGEQDDVQDADRYEVKKAIRHPLYFGTPPFDVAVVILKKKIKFGEKVQMATVAKKNPREGAMAEVIGFGISTCDTFSEQDPNGACLNAGSAYLRSAPVKIESVASFVGMIRSQGDNQTACYGDSGGPMVYNGKIVGVASTVNKHDCSDGGNVYTSVPYNWWWLKKYLK